MPTLPYRKAYVEITNICNMACSFCHGHRRAPRQMSETEFTHILRELRGLTEYLYFHLMGEPLTHPLLPAFLRLARESGFKTIVTTNGTLLAERGDELLRAGLYKINISLHSFEDGSDAAHVRYLTEVADFARRAAACGVIVVMRLWNEGLDGGKNRRVLEVLRDEIGGTWEKNTRGLRLRDKLHLEYGERFEWPDRDAPEAGERFFCYGLRDQLGILVDGSVVPCCLDSDGEITLGNVFRKPLGEILASPRARAVVDGFLSGTASEALCRRCGYAQRFI